jgi:hypothetical protein
MNLEIVRHLISSEFRSCGVSILALALEQLINGLRPVRSFVTNSHQAEGVGSVARKIVFRAKSNMPLLVFLLVVIAQAGNSGVSRFFIEKTERQYAPHSFNPLHCRAGTLVGYHDDIKSRILKVIAVTLAGDVVGVDTIMRQIANRVPFPLTFLARFRVTLSQNTVELSALLERKKILKALMPRDPLLRYSEHIAEFGRREFAKAERAHEEGVIAKRATGLYYSGAVCQARAPARVSLLETA